MVLFQTKKPNLSKFVRALCRLEKMFIYLIAILNILWTYGQRQRSKYLEHIE
jgi:hypothetical protein